MCKVIIDCLILIINKMKSKILVKEFESLMELVDWLDFESKFGEFGELEELGDKLVSGELEEGEVLEKLDGLDGLEVFLGEMESFVLRVKIDKLK